jgi:DNA-binding response OmpR family regulator
MKIIVLTKNILAEQQLQVELQLLGYEVFVSSSLLNYSLFSTLSIELMKTFDLVLLSENLANAEVRQLVSNLTGLEKTIIRISNSQAKEEIDHVQYVSTNNSIDQLRETLAASLVVSRQTIKVERPYNVGFSAKERLLFEYLKTNGEQTISREILCNYIWEEDMSNSRMTQLSCLVKNINTKLRSQGIEKEQIQTVWGKGYKFSLVKETAIVN